MPDAASPLASFTEWERVCRKIAGQVAVFYNRSDYETTVQKIEKAIVAMNKRPSKRIIVMREPNAVTVVYGMFLRPNYSVWIVPGTLNVEA